ncbi:MAG: VOC family protein [Deferribacteres bacterium]|nr:VOC family protein [candidate division KSB1 bacterium]MCB9511781.1 VOC family protein [Deferribacteres bacterium]
MARKIKTHLMFEGCAEEAMNLYITLFSESKIVEIEKYGAHEAGPEGSVKRASFLLDDREFICIDSPVKHNFSFTPSVSIFVECESLAEAQTLYKKLSLDGSVLMPLDDYGFSKQFAWVTDRFGVSWQINLA